MIVQGPHTGLKGVVKEWQVINSDGSIDQQGGGFENLILDQGLDQVASNYFASVTQYCAVGTGTTAPAQSDTGLVNESARTGNIFSNNTGTYAANNERISGGTDIWSTNNVDGTDLNIIEIRRTFEFPVGSLDSNTDGDYGELGFSPINSSGTNLFSRTLFRDGSNNPTTVTVNSDQSLRITYSLFIEIGLTTQNSSSASITNIGTVNFTHMIQSITGLNDSPPDGDPFLVDLHVIESDGVITGFSNGVLEPSDNGFNSIGQISPDTYTYNIFGNANEVTNTVSSDTVNTLTYTGGNYYIDMEFVWEPTTYNGQVYTIALAVQGWYGHIYILTLDSGNEFTKADTHRLTLTFRKSWGRA